MTANSPSTASSQSGGNGTFMLDKPKFGSNLKQTGPDSWAAWTGGKPKADWSGLVDEDPNMIGPNQFRASSVASRAKSQSYRIQGTSTKFTRDGNLLTFQKKLMKHFVQYGLDTITYLRDPTVSERRRSPPTHIQQVLR